MKINFKDNIEKEIFIHILSQYFTHSTDNDVLGCEPACRDESSPGCDWCIENHIKHQLNQPKEDGSYNFTFHSLGGEYILKTKIASED